GVAPDLPFGELPKKLRDIVLYGAPGQRQTATPKAPATSDKPHRSRHKPQGSKDPFGIDFEGVIPSLRRRFEEGTWTDQEALEPYRALRPCPACDGERL